MGYQKIINKIDDAKDQPSKFRKRNWIQINHESRETVMLIVTLVLKLQWSGQIYVIIVMHIYNINQLFQTKQQLLHL